MFGPIKKLIEKHKLLGHLVAAVLALSLLVAGVIVYFSNSFSWFSNNREVAGTGAQVKVGADQFPEMHAWRFELTQKIPETDEEDADSLEKTGTWINALDNASTTNPKAILPIVENANGEKYSFKSLHLGTVDNLLSLSADNCFYIRFDITDKIYQVSLSYSLNEAGTHFYQTDGTEIEPSQDFSMTPFVDLLVVDYFISDTLYDPTTDTVDNTTVFDAMETLFTNDSLVNNASPVAVSDTEQTEDYYLYIRFAPDLDKCFSATDDIAQYMPCEITFDVTLSVEFN